MPDRKPSLDRPAITNERRNRALRRTRLSAAAITAVGALVLSACGATSNDQQVDLANAEPRSGGTIIYAHDQEPPCLWGGWVQQAYISRQILDSLVSQTDSGEIVPWLATKWEVSDDQKTWTFTLKEGVKFSDGTPVDAEAIHRNFEYWLPEGGNSTVAAYLGPYYDSSRAVSPYVFELTLKSPYSPLLSALSQAYFGIQSPQSLERDPGELCTDPIGSGPFIVDEWHRGSDVTLVRNDSYNSVPTNAKHQGPAYVEKVVWKFVHDPVARYAALTTGEADVIYDVPTPQWDAAKSEYDVLQYITPGHPVSLDLNTVQGPFSDVLVRKAFAYSSDRAAAVKSAFHGVIPFEGNGALSQSTPGYNADVVDDYPFDQAKANELLDEAGWTGRDEDGYRTKDGKTLEVEVVYGAGSIVTAEGAVVLQTVQEQAKDVGFKVVLVPLTQDQLFGGAHSTPDTRDVRVGYWTSPTAGELLISYRQNLPESPNPANYAFFNSPEIESLILDANATLDKAEQSRLYGQAQQRLSDEAVSIGLYTQTTSLAIDDSLRDVWLEASQGEPVFHDAYFVQ